MRKQLLAMALVIGIALVIQLGCSGTVNPNGGRVNPPTGTVVVFGGDAPVCTSILSFDMTITGMTLTPASGSSPVSILSSGTSLTLDYASLMDYGAPITLASIATGSYSQLNLTLSNAQLTYWDTTKTPAGPTTLPLNLSLPTVPLSPSPTLTVTLNLSPALTVSSSGTTALQLDFDMLHSLVLDQNNQITSTAVPTFTPTATTLGTTSTFAKIEDLRGIANNVKTTSANSAYTGSFELQSTAPPTVLVNVSGSTKFDGVAGLSALAGGTYYVQVAASIDASGNLLADEVQVEEQEDAANGQAAFWGVITAVTRDTSGNATQFKLLVSEEAPDMSSQVSLQSVLTFNVPSSPYPSFAITGQAQAANLANFTFNAQTLGIGQQVVVHGQLPASGTTPFVADARAIYLSTQAILGNLSTLPSTPIVVGSDGKTGGFTLSPCSSLYAQPITDISYFQTTFLGTGLTNLSSLQTTETHFLLTKGLLFYQQAVGQVNSVAWAPPANVQVATQVHQLTP
jgi:hypothetical protein